MEAPESYFWRIIIFPVSDFIWVPPFFYTSPIFSPQRHHVLPGRGLSGAGLGRRGVGWVPGEAGELGREEAGKLPAAGAVQRARQPGSRAWGGPGVTGKRLGKHHGFGE